MEKAGDGLGAFKAETLQKIIVCDLCKKPFVRFWRFYLFGSEKRLKGWVPTMDLGAHSILHMSTLAFFGARIPPVQYSIGGLCQLAGERENPRPSKT